MNTTDNPQPLIPAYRREPRLTINYRRLAKRLAITAAILATLAVILWFAFPHLYAWHLARRGLSNLQVEPRIFRDHHVVPVSETVIFIENTFDNDWITNQEFQLLYHNVTAALSARTGSAPVYRLHTDEEGWESLRAIWQLPDGFAELSIGSGNDNNYAYLLIGPGTRPVAPREIPSSPAKMSSIFIR